MSAIVVFVGPSVEREAVAELLPEAELLMPIERGDLDRLMARDEPPTHIGIVDGKFLHAMSISPKEVITTMNAGARVYGSSSMGALRAAELDTHGMTGIGEVYRMYATEAVDADDEVAIVFDPDSGRALSVPMVNYRCAVPVLVEQGLLTAAEGELVLDTAKGLHFPERTHRIVSHHLAPAVGPERAEEIRRILAAAPDQKREDALELVATIRDEVLAHAGC